MKCLKCGSDIQEDLVYCPKCGEEIQYVPEFEPEIEQSIRKSMSGIAPEVNEYDKSNQSGKSVKKKSGFNETDLIYIFEDEDDEVNEYTDQEEPDYSEQTLHHKKNIAPEHKSGKEFPEKNRTASPDNEDAEAYDYADEYSESEDYDESFDQYEDLEQVEEYVEYDDYDDYDEEYLDDFDEEYDGDYEYDFEDEDEDIPLNERFRMLLKSTKNRVILIILAVILLVGVVFGIVYVKNFSKSMVENNSYSYQASLARQSALAGDYQTAIEYMEKALSLNSSDSTMKYDLAQYYFKNNESEKAILILWEIIYGKENGYENAYGLILDYYISLQDYKMVKQILDNCESSNVLKKYSEYLANAPEFSEPEGTYEDVIYLKLSSASAGTIYYTTDGTEPTLESNIYIEPLVLELGRYNISAFFVNSYGIASDSVKMTYTIDIRVPDAPEILLEEGEYTTPELIKVEAQKFCTVHYTTDGSSPTIDSPEYTGPIPMPLGVCQFTFAAFTQDGVCGDLAEVTYSLLLDSEIQISDIIGNIQQYNLNMGKTSNLQGLMLNGSSVYSYTISSAIALNEKGMPINYDENEEENSDAVPKNVEGKSYYIIVETLIDINNIAMKTGTIYLADAETGDLYKANKEEETNLPILGDQVAPELYAPIVGIQPENEAQTAQ